MANDPSQVAAVIGVVSAATAVVSALCSFLSYRKSVSQFDRDHRDRFISQTKEKLDKIYTDLSEFVGNFTRVEETEEKRIVRDRVVFSIEALRVDFLSCELTDTQIDDCFGDISLLMSDITYEGNFEKNMRDLATVRGRISDLKSNLMELGE